MVEYEWVRRDVPDNLQVKQVYGIVFDDYGRIFLRVEDGKYKLTGGKPNNSDKNFKDTLKREFLEEVNISLKDIYFLGYQYVDEKNGILPYAQVRMIAKIDKIFENRPDIDNGKMYKRLLTTSDKAMKYLNFDEAYISQIKDAIILAKSKFKFSNDLQYEEFL